LLNHLSPLEYPNFRLKYTIFIKYLAQNLRIAYNPAKLYQYEKLTQLHNIDTMKQDMSMGPMPKSIKRKKSRKKRAKAATASKRGIFCAQKRDETSHLSLYSKKFRHLQSFWYKELTKSGFKDIEAPEWTPKSEPGMLRANSLRAIANSYKPETEHYYACLRCYLTFNATFNDQFGQPVSKKKYKAAQLVAEGVPYRSILKQIDGMVGPKLNLWSLSQLANHFIHLALTWNKKSHHGLNYRSDI
jgi:hypothetical protein